MARLARYRIDHGERCIDVRAAGLDQLFDFRDPSPFQERDLDPDVVDYVVEAADDIGHHGPFRIVFWLTGRCDAQTVTEAFRAHFGYELDRLERRKHRQRRTGFAYLVVALALLLVFQTLARLVAEAPGGAFGNAVAEGLVIFGWVALWRPVDVLFYEWLPLRRHGAVLRRILEAPVDVRVFSAADADHARDVPLARLSAVSQPT